MPSVTLVTEKFLNLARTVARAKGVSTLPIVALPANAEFMTEEEIRVAADKAFQEVVAKLKGSAPETPIPA
ncbi:MAG: hypothetical protein HYX92_20880 [Chloroflexi bacterium]|nr:hypothetical protein [Chloroflexota bacterium]